MRLKKQDKSHPLNNNRTNDLLIRPTALHIAKMNKENSDGKATNSDSDPEVKRNHFGESSFNQPFVQQTAIVQAKLNRDKSQATDKYEKEADTVADKVVNKSDASSGGKGQVEAIQKKEGATEESGDNEVQMKSLSSLRSSSKSVESKLNSTKGQGAKMNRSTKNEMESGFGRDFGNVNIHTGSDAVEMNTQLGAKAFANGNDVYFNKGEYNPSSKEGKHLLAHELTHTVQQSNNTSANKVQLSRLRDFKGERITNEQIRTTNEYKSLIDPNSIWQTEMLVSNSEALYTCKLMLKDLNKDIDISWENDTRDYIWKARRGNTRGVSLGVGNTGYIGAYIYYVQNANITANATSLEMFRTNFKERNDILMSSEMVNIIRTRFSGGDAWIETQIQKQMTDIIARYNNYSKDYQKGNDPAGTKDWVSETGVDPENPYFGITKAVLEAVYRASMNTEQPPELLLALWVKEGKVSRMDQFMAEGVTQVEMQISSPPVLSVPGTVAKEDARAYIRSYMYYWNMGSEHYAAFIKTSADNLLDQEYTNHEPAFSSAIEEMIKKGFLRPDFSIDEINSSLQMSKDASGRWVCKPTSKFFELSLELTSAYFSSLKRNKYEALDNKTPSTELTYASWNMGEESFEENMLGDPAVTGGLKGAALDEKLVHSDPQGGFARTNMIKFGILLKSYKLLFK